MLMGAVSSALALALERCEQGIRIDQVLVAQSETQQPLIKQQIAALLQQPQSAARDALIATANSTLLSQSCIIDHAVAQVDLAMAGKLNAGLVKLQLRLRCRLITALLLTDRLVRLAVCWQLI